MKEIKRLEKEDRNIENNTHLKCANIINHFNHQANKYFQSNYNYTADYKKPIWQNKKDCFNEMKLSTYYQNQGTIGYYNLTKKIKPLQDLELLLKIGRKFIPQRSRADIKLHQKNLDRISEDIRTKYMMRDSESEAPKLYCKNPHWIPPPAHPKLEEAISKFKEGIIQATTEKFINQPRATNLTLKQQNLLNTIREHLQLMIIGSDKNLGLCMIEREQHHKLVFDQHLSNKEAYKELTKEEAEEIVNEAISTFRKQYSEAFHQKKKLRLTSFYKEDITYIERTLEYPTCHSQFYILAKMHKKNQIP